MMSRVSAPVLLFPLKGYGHLPQLLKALDRLVPEKGLDDNRKVA